MSIVRTRSDFNSSEQKEIFQRVYTYYTLHHRDTRLLYSIHFTRNPIRISAHFVHELSALSVETYGVYAHLFV